MRFPRFDRADPASSDFEARCFGRRRQVFSSLGPETSSVLWQLLHTLIEALPNYHVGGELALRLLDSRGVRKSREDQYRSAVVIKSPTLRAAFLAQHIHPDVCTYERFSVRRCVCVCVCRNEIRAFEIELDIYRFGKCGRCGMLSESQIEVLPRVSRSFVPGGARLSLRRPGGMHARHVGL